MAEVLNAADENSGSRTEGIDEPNKPSEAANTDAQPEIATSPPPPPPPRRNVRERERDSRDRRNDREFDRPVRREQYDRNRSPPPPPPPRDRDTHKRTRLSPSPPPPPYRDRRGGGPHSPPRRSSPLPPYKRRRDDIYDGRRRSPMGGYGPDRRFPYDYPGGYERDMVGRIGYPDERLHSRYMGRSSAGYLGGSSDLDSGRGAFPDAFNAGGAQREGMMSYKQFIQELEDDILPAEAEKRYQEYRSEYISTQKRNYFNAHKDEEWLKDKYHPTNLLAVVERRNELVKKLAKDFQVDLQNGTLDLGPGYTPSSKTEQITENNSDDEADVAGKRRRSGRGNAKESDHLSAPKSHLVFSEPRRIQIDIHQVLSLVRKLDSEKGIEENILVRDNSDRLSRDKAHGNSSGPVVIIRGSNAIKGLEGVELLDTGLTYLWRIHGLDYYGLVESSDAKGLRHVRTDGNLSDVSLDGEEIEKKLDAFWQNRLNGSDPLEIMTAKEKIKEATTKEFEPFVRKIRDEKYGWKYGCGAKGCTKLFHAAEYVHKHLKLKHPELVTELLSKVHEELYYQNYMNDENAPGGKPVMQQSFSKDRLLQRGRPSLESRLKDDRGNRRDHRANGNDKFDNLQSRDANNPDDALFDSFGGSGIPVAAFPLDIAPPVLMPVPGAGPLGPFVPAPPEVAMQMLRDQGGPSPFEGGRNGPPPIIAMPSSLRQDPRHLRSYNDLDAPEDEVTVIDYRSL